MQKEQQDEKQVAHHSLKKRRPQEGDAVRLRLGLGQFTAHVLKVMRAGIGLDFSQLAVFGCDLVTKDDRSADDFESRHSAHTYATFFEPAFDLCRTHLVSPEGGILHSFRQKSHDTGFPHSYFFSQIASSGLLDSFSPFGYDASNVAIARLSLEGTS
jgi:hypothetical protein